MNKQELEVIRNMTTRVSLKKSIKYNYRKLYKSLTFKYFFIILLLDFSSNPCLFFPWFQKQNSFSREILFRIHSTTPVK